jgi:DNA polymerase I
VEVSETHYGPARSASDVEEAVEAAVEAGLLAIAIEAVELAGGIEEEESEETEASLLPLQAEREAPRAPRTVAISGHAGAAVMVSMEAGDAWERLVDALSNHQLPKAIHDYKSALHAWDQHGIPVRNVRHDSMLYSYLLDPTYTSHRLADVALRRFNLKLSGTLSESADLTGRLAHSLRLDVEQAGLLKLYNEVDLPLVGVLARMELAGVKIDRKVLGEMSSRLEKEIAAKAREIYECCGSEFNINSPKQLGEVLFNQLNLPKPVKYGKGRTISTAVDVLESLAASHAAPRLVLEYRQLSKLKSTYVDALPAMLNSTSGRLHTTFAQTGTATGRLSSANPNLQNIPIRTELGREIRAAFTAEPGHVLLAADYSQIELRLLAHFSKDQLLVEAYRKGDDIHTLTASQVFGVPPLMVTPDHRRQAKVVNFGIVYGLSAFGLSQNLGIEPGEAKQFINAYFEKYKGVRKFIDDTLDQARRDGKVSTLFGRVRPIPDINSKNSNLRGFAERTAVNTPLQGTAADLIKIAMIRIDGALREQGLKSRMTLQVHDELVFEVPESEIDAMRTLVRDQMEQVHPLTVPLLVEIGVGPNWRDLE